MSYERPKITDLGIATRAIQGAKDGCNADSQNPSKPETCAAYEADE